MKIVIAPDSFKDCMTAARAAEQIADGIARVIPDVSPVLCPMSDGGEGTVENVSLALRIRPRTVRVRDPLGRPVPARYLVIGDIALIEMAEASGLERLKMVERNPMMTHTEGTGQLILHALDTGIRRFILAVGGSATVDGGMGMASALGLNFHDKHGNALPPCGASLECIDCVDDATRDNRVRESEFRVATDVISPLLGPGGAARMFGPQKGATSEMVERLEAGLANLRHVLWTQGMLTPLEMDGDGAAGGMGMGARAFLGGTIVSGAGTVAELVRLEKHMDDADWVVTGEGRTDGQSAEGKLCGFIEAAARRRGIPVVLLSGQIRTDAASFITRFAVAKSVTPQGMQVSDAIAHGPANLRTAASEVFEQLANPR